MFNSRMVMVAFLSLPIMHNEAFAESNRFNSSKDISNSVELTSFFSGLEDTSSDVLNAAVRRLLMDDRRTGKDGFTTNTAVADILTSSSTLTDFDTLQAQVVNLSIGIPVALSVPFLEDSAIVNFANGFSFPFYGQSYASTFAGFNGSISFGGQDANAGPKDVSSFLVGAPKLSGAYGNFTGTSSGGSIVATQIDAERVLFEYRNITGDTTNNNWNVTLYNSGQIDLSYPGVINEASFILGASNGSNVSGGSQQVDFLNPPTGSGVEPSIYQVASDGSVNPVVTPFNLEGFTVSLFPNAVGSYDYITQAIPEPSVGLLSSGSLALLFLGMSRALPGRKRAKK